MRKSRFIRARNKRRSIRQKFDLQLTSMLDILVIILVFLLKTFAVSTNSFTTVPGIKIPITRSPDGPPDSLHLIVTPESMTFEDEKILEFVLEGTFPTDAEEANYEFKRNDLDEGGRRVLPLYDALMEAKDQSELLRARSKARDDEGNPLPFDGVLAIQADKRIHYDTLRKIMYTAATAGYKVFRFLAMKNE